MEIGVGLDASLRLSLEQQEQLSREAAELGYTSIWTPEGNAEDSFLLCAFRWKASADVVPGGLSTGIAVSPVGLRTPMGFAMSAGTVSKLTGGRFVLGVGSGAAYTPQYRQTFGMQETSSLRLMRDYVSTIRGLLAGESATIESKSFSYRGARLGIDPPPRTPVYLAALGPEMLKLAGEAADGVSLNWCSAEQVPQSRALVAEGAKRAGRDPAFLNISEYIRICVDDDVKVAKRAYTRAVMGYAMGRGTDSRGRPQGYRAHFERMGFARQLAAVDEMRAKGAAPEEVVDAFPDEVLRAVGYYGPAGGAAKAFKALAADLDTAIVRVVAARPTIESARAVMEACRPDRVRAA
jgi:alkanesulfonate monooxygenase SsuD/methylene tetrahydromethanopterin reductase-like flavin-dependent oxidoreductase (luciferase family)